MILHLKVWESRSPPELIHYTEMGIKPEPDRTTPLDGGFPIGVEAMKTFVAKPSEIERKWYIVDATDKVLGRLATEVAKRLRGKHKPIYTPSVDTGDHVVVINAEKIRLTGNKMDQKVYYHHTGHPGGIKSEGVRERLNGQFPERVVEAAVKGMLPKGPLGRSMGLKLQVYAGDVQPHGGQQPEEWKPA